MIVTVTAERRATPPARDRGNVARRAALVSLVAIAWAATTLMLAAAIMLADPASAPTPQPYPAPAPMPQPIEAPPGLGL
jgi:hypothetical protein